jgi:transcriptional regulator with XRE-family HTH domain
MVNRLRELRKKKKYTLDDIEAKTGVKRGTYNNYESGKTEPKPSTWQALADFFNVSVDYLKGYGYSKEYIYKCLDDAYKEPYVKGYEVEPPFTSPFLSARDAINNYCKQNKISIPKDTDLKFWQDNFSFIFKDRSVNRLLTTKDSYTDNEIKEIIINAIFFAGLSSDTKRVLELLKHNN